MDNNELLEKIKLLEQELHDTKEHLKNPLLKKVEQNGGPLSRREQQHEVTGGGFPSRPVASKKVYEGAYGGLPPWIRVFFVFLSKLQHWSQPFHMRCAAYICNFYCNYNTAY